MSTQTIFDPRTLVHSRLQTLKPYQPGKPIAECQRELGIKDFIKLASNENPLGTSEYVTSNLAKTFSELALYPDGNAFDLKKTLSEFLNVKFDSLIMGSGSEDVLKMAIQTFVWGNHEVLVPQYAFSAYKILAQGLGLNVREIPAKQYGLDVFAMINAITPLTRMIIFANPNNPTGTYINHQALVTLLDAVPEQVIVVCDEAYYEYVTVQDYPQTTPLLKQYPNLIITRTFSKAYGLAGLRIGYGIADSRIIELMNRLRQPFNVNLLAQVGAILALQDQSFVKKSITLNEQGKKQLSEGFSELGLKYLPTHGNFFALEIKRPGVDIFQALLRQGIIIRPLAPYQMQDFYRITIGTHAQNQACLNALKNSLQGDMT